MAIRIEGNLMALEVGGAIWLLRWAGRSWLSRDQAITALTLAERAAAGSGDDEPFVRTWRKELFL